MPLSVEFLFLIIDQIMGKLTILVVNKIRESTDEAIFPGFLTKVKSKAYRLMQHEIIIGGNCDIKKEIIPLQINFSRSQI